MDYNKILDANVRSWDHTYPITIREYLKGLLKLLWEEGEGFNGKRPYGNSGWQYSVYTALVEHEFVDGTLDDEGGLDEINTEVADKLIFELIEFVFTK